MFERFIYAMRADLGHDDKELAPGDLLRVFINDLDEHWRRTRKHLSVREAMRGEPIGHNARFCA